MSGLPDRWRSKSALRALADAGVSASEITHLVTVSCSGFSAPGFDLALVRELPLRQDVSRSHIGFMGCHGALNGLRVAQAFAESDPGACVIVCALELCSLHHQYHWQPNQIVANALFADGAAAVVVRAEAKPKPGGKALSIIGLRSAVLPESADFIQWHIGDNGFEMALSPQLPGLIKRTLGSWLESWLGEHGLSIGQVGSWAIHPGGPKILEACRTAIDARLVPEDWEQESESEQSGRAGSRHAGTAVATETRPSTVIADSKAVLAEFGNMSSPTVLFILDRLRKRRAPRPIVSLAFGPGVAIEGALLS